MNSKQIQEMINTSQWGMWLRYVKKNNIKNEGGQWPNSEFHDFYVSLDVKEVEGEATCKAGSCVAGSESVVPRDVPEGHGVGEEVGLHAHDHVAGRREAHDWEPPLPEPSYGPQNVRLTDETAPGV